MYTDTKATAKIDMKLSQGQKSNNCQTYQIKKLYSTTGDIGSINLKIMKQSTSQKKKKNNQ